MTDETIPVRWLGWPSIICYKTTGSDKAMTMLWVARPFLSRLWWKKRTEESCLDCSQVNKCAAFNRKSFGLSLAVYRWHSKKKRYQCDIFWSKWESTSMMYAKPSVVWNFAVVTYSSSERIRAIFCLLWSNHIAWKYDIVLTARYILFLTCGIWYVWMFMVCHT